MRFMKTIYFAGLFLTACAVAATISACDPVRPTLHESFGASVIDARQAQIANPRASENLTPVAQLNGLAATKVMQSYAKTFEPEAVHKVNAKDMFVGLGAAGGGE